jgi:predicted Zn-dependent protease
MIMMTTITHRISFFFLFAFSFSLYSCSGGVNLYSKQQDIQLGQQMQAQIAKEPVQYPVLNNPTIRNYVQGLVNRIIQSPNVTNKDFNYAVTIIHDDNTVNAFTLPGGPIYVYTGLMKFVDNEATLAGILAHEVTHADHRHSTQQMTKQYGLDAVTQFALGNNASLAGQIAAGLATGAESLTMLQFSRTDETEADANSFTDLYTLPGRPWYPAAIKFFMVKTLSTGGSQPPSQLSKLFLTHPPSQERLNATNAQAQKANLPQPTEAQLNTAGYQRYRAMLP